MSRPLMPPNAAIPVVGTSAALRNNTRASDSLSDAVAMDAKDQTSISNHVSSGRQKKPRAHWQADSVPASTLSSDNTETSSDLSTITLLEITMLSQRIPQRSNDSRWKEFDQNKSGHRSSMQKKGALWALFLGCWRRRD